MWNTDKASVCLLTSVEHVCMIYVKITQHDKSSEKAEFFESAIKSTP